MIRYFWKCLKPFIKVKIEQQDRASTSFKEMVQKAVNAEAKTGLRFSTIVQDSNAHYLKSHRPSYNTSSKMQTQSFNDSFRFKETKPKDLKSASSYDNVAKLPKKDNKKDKKKTFWGQRRKHTRKRKKQTSTTNVNTNNVLKKKKKRCDVSEIMCFNCNEKSHLISNYIEPKN